MDPSLVGIRHIIWCAIFMIFTIISIVNAIEFIYIKEKKNSILYDQNTLRSLVQTLQYLCMLGCTFLGVIIPIIFIATVCGYNTSIVDIVTNW